MRGIPYYTHQEGIYGGIPYYTHQGGIWEVHHPVYTFREAYGRYTTLYTPSGRLHGRYTPVYTPQGGYMGGTPVYTPQGG